MKRGCALTQDLHSALQACKAQRLPPESSEQRWSRFYRAEGGPLMGWLLDEAAVRGFELHELARELRVTIGYLAQLHCGLREMQHISREFAAACGVFLGVPAVVVWLLTGHLKLVDLVSASAFERWVEDDYLESGEGAAQLPCGAQLGMEELRLLPVIVKELRKSAGIHEIRSLLY
jgi:transcriptional regulator with XRE-family HTH domain